MKRLLKLVLIIAGGAVVGLFALLVLAALFSSPSREVITKAEYGDRWPLTVDRGSVECVGVGAVLFHATGETFAVNGLALSAASYPPIDPIWRDDPSNPGLKINLSPIIDRGLALCD